MRIVYICEPNCNIHKSMEALLIKKGGYKINMIPLVDVGCIVIFGNTQISSQTLSLLFSKGIDVVFMSTSGLVKGRIMSEKSSNVVLRIAQYNRWKDEKFGLDFSRKIIGAKIQNQKTLLKSHYYSLSDEDIKTKIDAINELEKRINTLKSINSLMGVEGMSAKNYFSCFNKMLKKIDFSSRQKRPAHDPVNSLLNLGYAFLRNEISARLYTYSFDLELGFLHGIRYGRKSLPLDLMEEFRPTFIDKYVIQLFNKKVFKRDDFDITEEGCVLKHIMLKRFCAEHHRHVSSKADGEKTWKDIFDWQVRKFRKTILEGADYSPFVSK